MGVIELIVPDVGTEGGIAKYDLASHGPLGRNFRCCWRSRSHRSYLLHPNAAGDQVV